MRHSEDNNFINFLYSQFTFKSVLVVQTATEKDNSGISLFPAMGTPAQSSITVQSRCISQIQDRARNLLFSLVNLDHKIKKVIYVTMTSHLDKIHQRIVAVFQKPQAKILKEQPVIKVCKIATFVTPANTLYCQSQHYCMKQDCFESRCQPKPYAQS